ncbi:MAG TPA: DUF4013 domain-containing protein [Candidatus Dormibacteraeota bacterium]|nr:DUF4013 domain-containing protein [Candidatus Dormibacteraeota bacterium]
MRAVAESFAWPFRAGAGTWIWGCLCVLLLPLLFIPLYGYAIAAIRQAEQDRTLGPPAWRFNHRMIRDGAWTFVVVSVAMAPIWLFTNPLADVLATPAIGPLFAHVFAELILLLPTGILALLILPHATSAYAATGNPRDIVNVVAALRGVRRDFATWNLTVAAIVTAWAIAIACVGLLCVGIVPGVFYAILVSAHAAAPLHRQIAPNPNPSAR